MVNDKPDHDGWTNIRMYGYQTSPNEKRGVGAQAHEDEVRHRSELRLQAVVSR